MKVIPDPLRGGKNVLVLCDTYRANGQPADTNFRAGAKKIFDAVAAEEPWFSFEQEYIMQHPNPDKPIGFMTNGTAEP